MVRAIFGSISPVHFIFILLAIFNRSAFMISFLGMLSLECKMLEFYVLVLCPAALLGLFLSPSTPSVVSLGFSTLGIISSTTWGSLTTVSLLHKTQNGSKT